MSQNVGCGILSGAVAACSAVGYGEPRRSGERPPQPVEWLTRLVAAADRKWCIDVKRWNMNKHAVVDGVIRPAPVRSAVVVTRSWPRSETAILRPVSHCRSCCF